MCYNLTHYLKIVKSEFVNAITIKIPGVNVFKKYFGDQLLKGFRYQENEKGETKIEALIRR